jgi:hypothetical protein
MYPLINTLNQGVKGEKIERENMKNGQNSKIATLLSLVVFSTPMDVV